MAEATTSDANKRAKLTVNATGGQNRIDWSASVTDNNATSGGFGDSGAWSVTVGGIEVTAPPRSGTYDFGSGVYGSPYFPRSESSARTGLPAGTYTITGTFRGNVGSTTVGTATIVSFDVVVSDPPPPPPAPSAVSVESLTRTANGTGISLTSSTSTFSGSGGYYQWRWSYDNANWSAGITMSGRSGSGTGFSSANTIYVQVIAIDSAGNSGWSASASIAGISAPAWSTGTALSAATRGSAYSVSLSASPATSYELIGSTGTITGLSVASNGVLSGTPTTTNSVTLNVRAYNYDRTTDRNFSLTINPALPVFSDGSVNSSARVGIAYSDAVAASETASYSVFSGALPGGLSLNTSTGAITGTPTTPGTFTFVLRATNVTGSTNTGTLTITVISAARVWNGTAFVSGLANVWNGSAFVTGTIRVWDGTTWKNTN